MELINKIHLVNCLDYLKLIPDTSIDLVLTDPPYNISSDIVVVMNNHPKQHRTCDRQLTYDFGEWDHFDSEKEFLEFTQNWMKECYRVLKPSGNFVTFFANWNTGDIKRIWENLGGRPRQKLYWIKTNPKPRLRKVDFMQGVEEIFWGAKSEKGHVFNYELGQKLNYIHSAVFYNNEITGHPTQKPESTVDWIIKYLSNENDIILDPFCGSGTIPFVACKLNRKFIGIEKSEKWVNIANNRIANTLRDNSIPTNKINLDDLV